MVNQKHYFASGLLKKIISVTLVTTILFSMVIIGNVFGAGASAAESEPVGADTVTYTEGDYTYVFLDDGTAQITKYSGTEAQLTVPAELAGVSVSSIGSKAFEDNDEIESVTFSDGIVTIGVAAFTGCDTLEEIGFASSVTTIGKSAFASCRALQSVEVPATVKTIGDGAFRACPILGEVKLNEGLESLGNRFLSGTVVSEIYIPTTVTYANEAFAEADLLDSVTFGEGITAIPDDMFEKNNSLRGITIPDTVTKLGKDCLCNMGSLESIVIPDNVTEMGAWVLTGCPKLATVTLGTGITAIPNSAFEGDSSLKKIVIPANVTKIGEAAFKDCSKLADVTLNEGLVDIGYYSFERTAVREMTIPASVTNGSYPFNGCASLKTVNLTEGATALPTGLFQNTVVENVTVPEGVTALPEDLCKGCQKLTTVSLPSTLRTIGSRAFEGCTALDNVEIPESVKTVNAQAFKGTTALKNFTLHEGVQTLGYAVFEGSALTSIYIPKTLSSTDSPFAGSNITDVTFSEGITTLSANLFNRAGKLTWVKIPDTVIRIENGCFRESNVEAIRIPDSVKTLGSDVFYNCDNLYVAKFGAGVRRIPSWTFGGCDVLQNVIIPETIADMDGNVFEGSGLSYIKLPQSLHYIPNQTFKDCRNLKEVVCSDVIDSIGDYAFERCYEFTTLTTAVEEVDFNNTTFVNCPKFTDKRFYVFNPANTGIESTGNIGSDSTLVHFTVKYDIRDDWADEDIEMDTMYLSLPDSLELVTNSFAAEGFTFDNSAYTGDYKSFALTGARTRGELRFSAYLKNSSDGVKNVSAEVAFRHNGTYFRKPLGDVQFTTAKLSLFAPSAVTEPKVVVSGYTASADKDVTVYISRVNSDGTKEDAVSYSVTPNKYTGKYTSDELNILPEDKTAINGNKFEVYAQCDGAKSDVITFTYTPGALKVKKATETVNITKFIAPGETNLSHGSQANTYDITGIFTKGTSPVVMINPAEMLQFKFDFENDENISHMVLMSHKGEEWKFMELFYDAETDLWIGEGYFDIPNHELVSGQTYVPGALNLFFFRGTREDTYKSHYYGEADESDKNVDPVGDFPNPFGDLFGDDEDEDVFYYDANGQPHGNLGDYHETARDTVTDVIVDCIKGEWGDAASDAVTGGLHTLWQWGNDNDNFFSLTHGGVRIGPDGLPILPGDPDMYNRNPEKDGRQRNAIDPSGVVYEAVKGNPVEGATATIYKYDEDAGEWAEWNAADFEQQNPLLTNNEGAYAWFTDEGKFKVIVSKEGYETQTSEEFEIPPEKLGLNFSLVDKTTHPTATVTKSEESGAYTLKFNKFMTPDTVTTETVKVEGLTNVSITPVYLNEGDEYADTFTVKGKRQQQEIKFAVTDAALSYSGVKAKEATETIIEATQIGDTNGDGIINIADATMIQKAVAKLVTFTSAQETVADTNGDGKVTITDATTVQKYVAKLIDHFGE